MVPMCMTDMFLGSVSCLPACLSSMKTEEEHAMKMTEIWSKRQEGGKARKEQEGRGCTALGAEGWRQDGQGGSR